jgi:aldose 1-epimerase
MQIDRIYCRQQAEGLIAVFRITNHSGAYVDLCTIGAGIVAVYVPDSDGNLEDVTLGYCHYADYIGDDACFGKTPGRFANRIAQGKFTLDGVTHQLATNNGPNHLHGGPTGFANRIWQAEVVENQVCFTYESAEGEENYPGQLTARVSYSWSEENCLTIRLEASTTAPTVVNLTNHTYWNLSGENSGTVLNHQLQLQASHWLPTDSTLIPTGKIADVANSPMDFRQSKALARDIRANFVALSYGKGYDNCWVLDPTVAPATEQLAAELTDPTSKRRLRVYTTQPAVHVYTGNWLSGSPLSKSGRSYNDYDGVAIECQGFPDAPNHVNFPSAVLRPGQRYQQTIRFALDTL